MKKDEPPMDDLRRTLTRIAASLTVLGANTKANTEDLEQVSKDLVKMGTNVELMATRNKLTEEAVQDLRGTFASIEQHLLKLFEQDAAMKSWMAAMEARVEALEKRQPPAA